MLLIASFNGGLSDAEFRSSFIVAVLAAIVVGCTFGRGCRGMFLGTLIGALPSVWYMFLAGKRTPDISDLLLFFYIPICGLVGGTTGALTRLWKKHQDNHNGSPAAPYGEGKTSPGRTTGVQDREVDGREGDLRK